MQRLQKTLEEANVKLNSVICDIMGASGRKMLEAMIAGVCNPQNLAALAGRGIKASPKQLYDALHGEGDDARRFLLKLHLAQWDALEATIGQIDLEVDQRITQLDQQGGEAEAGGRPPGFRELICRLSAIPGSQLPVGDQHFG